MARWLKGAPKKIYVLVDNISGAVHAFDKKKSRTEWLKDQFITYPLDRFTFTTYVQEVK